MNKRNKTTKSGSSWGNFLVGILIGGGVVYGPLLVSTNLRSEGGAWNEGNEGPTAYCLLIFLVPGSAWNPTSEGSALYWCCERGGVYTAAEEAELRERAFQAEPAKQWVYEAEPS